MQNNILFINIINNILIINNKNYTKTNNLQKIAKQTKTNTFKIHLK